MSQYFYDVLVMDVGISKQQQEEHHYIPDESSGIWYLDNLKNSKPFATYIHLDEDADDGDENSYYNVLLFPDSIISISQSEGVKFYGRMLTD